MAETDIAETPNQTTQTPGSPPPTMSEVESEPIPPTTTKYSNVSFSIWPPTERTRDAVRNRLIETLSTPSILSKRYGTVSREEALEAAGRIEDEAYDAAGKASSTDDDGIEILQVYSKEISKRMLETVKARSDELAAEAMVKAEDEEVNVKAEDEDAGSCAPPQSEKTESVVDDD